MGMRVKVFQVQGRLELVSGTRLTQIFILPWDAIIINLFCEWDI